MYFSILNNRNKNKHIKKLTELVEKAGGSITIHDYNLWSTVTIRGEIGGYVVRDTCTKKYHLCVYDKNEHKNDYNVPLTSVECIYGF